MLMPPVPHAEMRVPSLWFRIKETGKCAKVYQPHWDGIHLQLEYSLRWFTLDELEPITEDEFMTWKESVREECRRAQTDRR